MCVKIMKMSEIKIPEQFKTHPPKRDKIDGRIKLARKRPLRVAVNKDGWLTDLYASYIAAQELGQDEIGTIPGRDTCTAVAAVFPRSGKEYTWVVPEAILRGWKDRNVICQAGTRLAVKSGDGVKQVRVVRVFELPFPSDHADILGLWCRSKYKPEQYAEHVKLCGGIAEYCRARDIRDLDGFLAAAQDDPDAVRLYQFASGKWASAGRRAMIQKAISGEEAGHDA